ncbi:Gfo/Idh/MocA family protein [Dongshaea marina]|uniref:Gfo/Idh/MocA family protein n=1 Tax=Dongshaea marina TaxID=2047966 RepID=UPI00131F4607|nr:Gfo/Idh/MocA family oxidoreductase [Dongshaea marina]
MTTQVLLLGFGSVAQKHIEALGELLSDVKFAVWCRPGKLRSHPKVVHFFYDAKQAIAWQPHLIIVTTPSSIRLELITELASLGCPMLIEKPLADSLSQAQEITCLLAKKNSFYLVAYQLRFLPSFLKLQQWLTLLGQLYHVRLDVGQYLPHWRPGKPVIEMVSASLELGGGALLELSHELDLMINLIGKPSSVFAKKAPPSHLAIEVEECVELLCSYPQGPLVSVHLDMLRYSPSRNSTWLGENGQICWDLLSDSLTFYDRTGEQVDSFNGGMDPGRARKALLESFINQSSRGCNLEQGCEVMHLIEACKESLRYNREIVL